MQCGWGKQITDTERISLTRVRWICGYVGQVARIVRSRPVGRGEGFWNSKFVYSEYFISNLNYLLFVFFQFTCFTSSIQLNGESDICIQQCMECDISFRSRQRGR
jgi:hypothetical protein